MENKNMTRISFDLPPELHHQFKLYCVENKWSITDKITDYIKQTLETSKAEKTYIPQAENNSSSLSKNYKAKNQNDSQENPEKKKQKTIIVNGIEYVYNLDNDLEETH
jgi:hypothetical protein